MSDEIVTLTSNLFKTAGKKLRHNRENKHNNKTMTFAPSDSDSD